MSRRGPYWGRADIDAWDERRDARGYTGSLPIVAHPPCTNWSNMAPVVQARRGQSIGSDHGCFCSALCSVRKHGGVLEQPAFSRAWAYAELQHPEPGHWTLAGDERFLCSGLRAWVCQVSQSAYGHRARKWTWLYYVGVAPPAELDWSSPKGTHVVSYCKRRGDGSVWNDDRPRLTKLQASLTPPAFAETLIQLAANSGVAL